MAVQCIQCGNMSSNGIFCKKCENKNDTNELRGVILGLEAKIKELEKECFKLSAGLCVHSKGVIGDEGGSPRCPITMNRDGGQGDKGMRTIKLWECTDCSSHCYTDDPANHECNDSPWEKITATIQEQTKPAGPRVEDLKFGDEIEVGYEGEWSEIKPFINIYEGKVGVLLNAYDTVITYFSEWRFPLKNKMMRGQPVVVGDNIKNLSVRLFKSFDEYNRMEVFNTGHKDLWTNWRFPTEEELEKFGHANGKDENGNHWLTEG